MVQVADFQTIGVNSITPHIGAEIEGVDLSKPLSNEQFSEVVSGLKAGDVVVVTNERAGLGSFFGG